MTNPLKYTCLFGGGAIRGMAYIGTIRALEELNIEYDIIGGSSVGSIMAALVACGYKSYELENLFMKVNFDLFKDIHLGFGKPLIEEYLTPSTAAANSLFQLSFIIVTPSSLNIRFRNSIE